MSSKHFVSRQSLCVQLLSESFPGDTWNFCTTVVFILKGSRAVLPMVIQVSLPKIVLYQSKSTRACVINTLGSSETTIVVTLTAAGDAGTAAFTTHVRPCCGHCSVQGTCATLQQNPQNCEGKRAQHPPQYPDQLRGQPTLACCLSSTLCKFTARLSIFVRHHCTPLCLPPPSQPSRASTSHSHSPWATCPTST